MSNDEQPNKVGIGFSPEFRKAMAEAPSEWFSMLMRDQRREHSARVEAHVRSELARLGVSEEEAFDRIVLVQKPGVLMDWPPALPEVMLKTTYEARYGSREAMIADQLPCPFCGSSDVRVANGDEVSWCTCHQCQADGPVAPTVETAIALWNDVRSQHRPRVQRHRSPLLGEAIRLSFPGLEVEVIESQNEDESSEVYGNVGKFALAVEQTDPDRFEWEIALRSPHRDPPDAVAAGVAESESLAALAARDATDERLAELLKATGRPSLVEIERLAEAIRARA